MKQSLNRLPGLDLLRAIAILWAMLFHADSAGLGSCWQPLTHFGWMGVDLFFVLSGFLIGSQLMEAQQSGRGLRIVDFYRWAYRILPAYAATVGLYQPAVPARKSLAAGAAVSAA